MNSFPFVVLLRNFFLEVIYFYDFTRKSLTKTTCIESIVKNTFENFLSFANSWEPKLFHQILCWHLKTEILWLFIKQFNGNHHKVKRFDFIQARTIFTDINDACNTFVLGKILFSFAVIISGYYQIENELKLKMCLHLPNNSGHTLFK